MHVSQHGFWTMVNVLMPSHHNYNHRHFTLNSSRLTLRFLHLIQLLFLLINSFSVELSYWASISDSLEGPRVLKFSKEYMTLMWPFLKLCLQWLSLDLVEKSIKGNFTQKWKFCHYLLYVVILLVGHKRSIFGRIFSIIVFLYRHLWLWLSSSSQIHKNSPYVCSSKVCFHDPYNRFGLIWFMMNELWSFKSVFCLEWINHDLRCHCSV